MLLNIFSLIRFLFIFVALSYTEKRLTVLFRNGGVVEISAKLGYFPKSWLEIMGS
jgi:hypothetical protein